MKKFIPLFAFAVLFAFAISCEKESTKEENVSHSNVEIGRVVNNDYVLTYDVPTLKKKWGAVLNHSPDLKVQLTSISIEEDENGVFLHGIDEINSSKSRLSLVLDKNVVYLHKKNARNGGNCTTTCSGCTSTGPGSRNECSPSGSGTQTYCTFCSKGTCTKTVSCGGIQ